VPGIAFQPIATDSVTTNFVTFEPNAVAEMHHRSEQQIAVGDETRVTHLGDCVVIPPNVPHGGTPALRAGGDRRVYSSPRRDR
jgi:uncharacterized RmlC-like cupin family protein